MDPNTQHRHGLPEHASFLCSCCASPSPRVPLAPSVPLLQRLCQPAHVPCLSTLSALGTSRHTTDHRERDPQWSTVLCRPAPSTCSAVQILSQPCHRPRRPRQSRETMIPHISSPSSTCASISRPASSKTSKTGSNLFSRASQVSVVRKQVAGEVVGLRPSALALAQARSTGGRGTPDAKKNESRYSCLRHRMCARCGKMEPYGLGE